MTTKTTKQKAMASVVKAAIDWVNFEDDGLVESMPRHVRVISRLVNSVAHFEKLQVKL